MKTFVEQLANYAEYHRSKRNIATHMVGIPMIVLAVMALLSRPAMMIGSVPVSAATLCAAMAVVYYLVLDIPFGLIMAFLYGAGLLVGHEVASLDTSAWLAWSIGGFVLGWIIQFVGHHFEGRKPAFLDDIMGLAIGPLFVVAELLFMFGAFSSVRIQIELKAGATRH